MLGHLLSQGLLSLSPYLPQQCQTCCSLLEHRHTKGEDPNQVISLLTPVGSFFSMVATSFSLSLLNVPGGSVNLSQSLSHFSPLSLEQPVRSVRSGKTGRGKSHWDMDIIIICKNSCFCHKEALRLLFRQHRKISANYHINYGGASSQTQI